MIARNSLVAAIFLVVATACSNATNSVVPSQPSAPSAALRKHQALAKLVIKVPPCTKRDRHCRRHRRDRFVSPATASLSYKVDAGSSVAVDLSTSNPNCTVAGPISYLQCVVVLALTPGQHTLSFTTYDQAGATGNVLSANTDVSFGVVMGQVNQIPVTLGGVAASLEIFPPNVAQVSGNQFGGYTIYGPAPLGFSIVPLDADNNFIVGPGAPQPRATAPANMSLSTPAPAAPNTWTLTSTYQPSDPATAASSSFTAVATPVPNSGGSTVTATVPLTLYQPWLYVVNNDNGSSPSMTVTDELGNAVSVSGFSGLGNPAIPAYDPQTGWIYVTDYTNNAIHVYDRLGNAQSPGGSFMSLNTPIGIAYDSNNGYLYVVNNGNDTMTYYDGQGNKIGSFSIDTHSPQRVAFNSSNDQLYVTNIGNNTISAYTESGTPVTLDGNQQGLLGADGITYDSHDGFLYVANNAGTSQVSAYNAVTTQQSFAFLTGSSLGDVTYDPNGGLLYVSSYSSGNVYGFNESAVKEVTIAGLHVPYGLVVVP